nr:hypothetical protein [Tanacetum cinerariifolium]
MLRVFPMTLTGAASRWLRNKPSGSIKTSKDLNTKFLSKYCLPARTVKKMEEINDFQQEPDKTLYQAWERFKELLMKCPHYYLTKMQDVILFYNGLDVPTRKILDSKGAIPTRTAADAKFGAPFQQGGQYKAAASGFNQRNNANPSYQERRQSMEESQSKFMSESAKRHEENSNLITEIQGASVSVMPLLTYLNIGLGELAHTKLMIELVDKTVKYPKGIAENVLVGIVKFVFPIDFIILDMPEDVKVPLILERPFLSTAYSKIDVFKRKIILKVGDEKIIFKSMKAASSLIKRVYMLVVENMDGYRDQDMGDIILSEPFCKASCVEARKFDG